MGKVDNWTAQLDGFLAGRSWERRICASCGRAFFAKRRNGARSCKRGKCSADPLGFLSLTKRKIPFAVCRIAEDLRKAFAKRGYGMRRAVNITATIGTTDLIGAGIQVLEPVLFGIEKPLHIPQFVLQPSVRMRHFGCSGDIEGSSTAFVNACSLEVDCPFKRHLMHFDLWLETLSGMGIFMGDVTILRRFSEENWGNGSFGWFELFVLYNGLELGDATYGLLPTRRQGILPVSDIGFGVERITWAINKTPSYFDLLRPVTTGLSLEQHTHDALRTAALFLLCGVSASNEGVGFQLRKMCKSALFGCVGSSEASELVLYYCQFWADFLEESAEEKGAMEAFAREARRILQARITSTLKVPKPSREETEAYAARLVYTLGVPIGEIRRALKEENHG